MASENEILYERIEACRRRLTTDRLSDESRSELLQLLSDLDRRFGSANAATSPAATKPDSAAVESPFERLRDFERSVEATHTVLCGLIGNLADSLSRIGI